jgi:serine protease
MKRPTVSKVNGIGIFRLLTLLAGLVFGVSAMAAGKRYIVTFKDTQTFRAASGNWQQSEKLKALGIKAPLSASSTRLFNTDAHIVKPLNNVEMMIIESSAANAVDQLKANPAVESVEEEIFLASPRPVNGGVLGKVTMVGGKLSCSTPSPWGIAAVKADKAWATTKGKGARVLILDTGVDKEHPAIKSRFEKGQNFVEPGTADVTDSVGHGTHVAGTVLADGTCLNGVAPEAKLLMGKVCDDSGCGSTAIVSGIDWGIQEHVDVISMSLGGAFSTPSQQRAVERAERARVVVVAATGNDAARRVSYPAAYESVIAVGAVDDTLKRAEFSNYGPGLDIMAPGVSVYSSVPLGTGRIVTLTVDMGGGKTAEVNSASMAGAPENTTPISGQFVHAGLGKPADVAAVNLRGKFALISRGEIPFQDKALNAQNAGAIGVIIYNNAPGLARGSVGDDGAVKIPAAMIEQSVGAEIVAELQKSLVVSTSIVTQPSDYDKLDGTSMATPHVAGVVALIRSANPQLSPAQVRDIIAKSAQKLGAADEYSMGLIDAQMAVSQARQTTGLSLAAGF